MTGKVLGLVLFVGLAAWGWLVRRLRRVERQRNRARSRVDVLEARNRALRQRVDTLVRKRRSQVSVQQMLDRHADSIRAELQGAVEPLRADGGVVSSTTPMIGRRPRAPSG